MVYGYAQNFESVTANFYVEFLLWTSLCAWSCACA